MPASRILIVASKVRSTIPDDPVDPRLHDAVPNDQVLRLIEARDVALARAGRSSSPRKLGEPLCPSPARAQAKNQRAKLFNFPPPGLLNLFYLQQGLRHTPSSWINDSAKATLNGQV